MEATVNLDHSMTFIGTANSGFPVKMDASVSVGGDDDGPRPLELMLISLGGCAAMDAISILRKKRQNVTGLDVQLKADRAKEHPKVFTQINMHYIVKGHNVDPRAVARSIELSETKYCPAQAMLAQSVSIESSFEIVEEVREEEPINS